eukprot:scaffold54661_cov45-Prasinocladus_malaysianus.AAC.1
MKTSLRLCATGAYFSFVLGDRLRQQLQIVQPADKQSGLVRKWCSMRGVEGFEVWPGGAILYDACFDIGAAPWRP